MGRLAWICCLGVISTSQLGCEGRERIESLQSVKSDKGSAQSDDSSEDGDLLEFDLTAGAPESPANNPLFAQPASRTFVGLVRAVERAQKNEKVKGAFIRFGSDSMDWARSEELGRNFAAFRKSGKFVACHANSLSNKSVWLAAHACDEIWLSPAGEVDTVGIAGQVIYLRGVLDKFKIRADFLKMGRYKSAAETMTRTGPTPEARESLVGVLASIRGTWLDSMVRVRSDAGIKKALEDGPWDANGAKQQGLIDTIGYASQAREAIKERLGETKVRSGFGASEKGLNIASIIRSLAGSDLGEDGADSIAVLAAQGAISMKAGGVMSSGGIVASSITKTIRRLAKDKSVKAVVLRIDSPGGSALASDLIWHELMELRKKKPLIASVGDMAASGGYYLACAADKIVAERTSIVGSIGVVGGKIVIGEALREFGINTVTFSADPNTDAGAIPRGAYMSALTPWDPATRAKVQTQMESIYELFLARVASGRRTPVDEIRKIAEGRIWSGTQGLKRNLVDKLGGVSAAIALARTQADLPEDAPVRLEGASESLLERLFLTGDETAEDDVRLVLRRFEASRSALLEILPTDLRAFVGSFGPLADGERVLTALPLGLRIH